ncbi:hypothetical protein N7495_001731 [Penicillium taxi]|uniref:uncharacterized protein n=1 Tax=Penicillium taxi TaxID=168475 RepID=UPI002544EBAD|nr:uncharacterized protein N7495_001731 [Penicillium taxi]KAJ5909049.1 hypothetical protein N7495_001731 [Penicillium taxi]
MMRLSLLAMTTLALTSIASPAPVLRSITCQARDTSTIEAVQAIEDAVGFIDWLDIMFISLPNGETKWLDALWEVVFPQGGSSPLNDCGTINGQCPIESLCSNYPNEMSYWVFHETDALVSKVNIVHSTLEWNGWLDSLTIDQISEDFSSPPPSTQATQWLSAAFSMAGGIATGVGIGAPLEGMIGFAAAGFTAVSLSADNGAMVDTLSLEATLRNMSKAAGNYVATMLSDATGNGDASALPVYTDTTYSHATSRFLYDSWILLDNDSANGSFTNAIGNFSANIVSLRQVYCYLSLDL